MVEILTYKPNMMEQVLAVRHTVGGHYVVKADRRLYCTALPIQEGMHAYMQRGVGVEF
jgi:hypothetical protein